MCVGGGGGGEHVRYTQCADISNLPDMCVCVCVFSLARLNETKLIY